MVCKLCFLFFFFKKCFILGFFKQLAKHRACDAMDEIMVYIDRHGLYREYEKLETEVRLKIYVVGDADEFIQKTLESHEVRFEVEEERDDHGKLMKKYIISK